MSEDFDRRVHERVSEALRYKIFVIVDNYGLSNIVGLEMADALSRAFTVVERGLAAAVSDVVGRPVEAEFEGFEMVPGKLSVKSRYRLVDVEEGRTGHAVLLGELVADDKGRFYLTPVLKVSAKIEMYGEDVDRQIEREVWDSLSNERLYAFKLSDILSVLGTSYGELLYEALKKYEDDIIYVLGEAFDVASLGLYVKITDIEVDPRAARMSVHYEFRAADKFKGVGYEGSMTVSGEVRYKVGELWFYPREVEIEYDEYEVQKG